MLEKILRWIPGTREYNQIAFDGQLKYLREKVHKQHAENVESRIKGVFEEDNEVGIRYVSVLSTYPEIAPFVTDCLKESDVSKCIRVLEKYTGDERLIDIAWSVQWSDLFNLEDNEELEFFDRYTKAEETSWENRVRAHQQIGDLIDMFNDKDNAIKFFKMKKYHNPFSFQQSHILFTAAIENLEDPNIFLEYESLNGYKAMLKKLTCVEDAKGVLEALKDKEIHRLIKISSKDILELVGAFPDKDVVLAIGTKNIRLDFLRKVYSRLHGKEEFIKTLSIIPTHRFYQVAQSHSNPLHMAQVYEKYDGHRNILVDTLFAHSKEKVHDYRELLSPAAEKLIFGSKNQYKLMRELLEHDYSEIRDKFEYANSMSYSELNFIEKTVNFVKEIHRERIYHAFHEIVDGFYKELNRAVGQGADHSSKVKLMKQYCREVENKVRERAEELMVVNNA